MNTPRPQEKNSTEIRETPRPLYFLHIPKTAGTTFMAILNRQFLPEEICPPYLWRDLIGLPSEQVAGYKLFRGHFYYYLHKILPRQPVYITFLRDPVRRALSHYNHILQHPEHYLHKKATQQNSLEKFLADEETAPMITNFQVRSLVLDLDPRAIARSLSSEDLKSFRFEQILESAPLPASLSENDALVLAQERLAGMELFGLVERFDETLDLFVKHFGWRDAKTYQSLNKGAKDAKPSTLSPSARKLLEKHLQLDIELYRYARKIFDEKVGLVSA